jgi:hypothetical protein
VGVTLTPPEIGVHDNFLVKWTYQYIPPARDGWNEWDEAPIVERWVDAVADNPVHRYGRQQFGAARYDPTAIEEDLGDNAIRAGNYGIANLKYILSHLREWITDDTDYRHRQMLYGEICDQYFRYIRAVAMNVGGIRLTVVKEGTRGTHIAPVSHELQRASLHWVIDQLRDMEWLDAPTLTRNFDLGTGGAAGIRGRVLELFRGMLPKVILSSHYAHHPYTIREFTNDLFHATWRGARRHPPTAADRALQREMVAMFCEPLTAMEASATETAISLQSLTSFESERRFGPGGMMVQDEVDVSAIDDSADYLTELAVRSRDYLERVTRHSRRGTHVHYHALLMKLNLALKDKY